MYIYQAEPFHIFPHPIPNFDNSIIRRIKKLKKILIIEDDGDNLFVLEYSMRELGVEVVTNRQVLSPVEIESISPDLILLDHWIGGSKGGDLCVELKASPATAAIPVVLVSAYPNLKKIADESCADGYVSKPFDLTAIQQLVEKFIS